MKKNLQKRLENYKASISQKEIATDLKKVGLSGSAALAAIIMAPVELTSQVVCGDMGAPTRTFGACTGDLAFTGYSYCAKFDFDGDGINELQVLYYYNYSPAYSANAHLDPTGNMFTANLYLNGTATFPLVPTAVPSAYTTSYFNRIYYIELSGGGGFGFITFDAGHYPAPVTHPVTGQFSCCRHLAAPEMWGAQSGITLADLEVQNAPVADESNLTSCEVLKPDALPVELSRFEAAAKENSILLEWTTETEINNSGFSIERSTDGKDFIEIAFENGQGESSRSVDYTFEDTDIKDGTTYYYRLRQIDFDGRTDLSEVAQVRTLTTKSELTFGPNPATESVNIQINSLHTGSVSIDFVSNTGQTMKAESFDLSEGQNEYKIDIQDLSSGVYFIKVNDGRNSFYEKFIVL